MPGARLWVWPAVVLGAGALSAGFLALKGRSEDGGEPYAKILNSPAPEWSVGGWANSEPLTLERLRGKAVLVRWWTGPGCPYCNPSAPRLARLGRRYKNQGLVVIGFYHHKSDEPLRLENVRRLAKKMGMDFPVAVDPEWRTLRRYWLDRVGGEPWTSVSFLIDQKGVVRYVHPGGEITEGDEEIISAEIESILKWRKEAND